MSRTRKAWRSYAAAHAFVRSLGLRNRDEWIAYCKSGQKPTDIPSVPRRVYADYRGVQDWLGAFGARRQSRFLPFEKAREHARTCGCRTWLEWRAYVKSHKAELKRRGVPSCPNKTLAYGEEWFGWGDWLGMSRHP